jgi:hypothetical protein
METYDNHHDSGLGYGALLCAIADDLCTSLARGIRKGYISKDFQALPADAIGGSGAQEAGDALSFIKSRGAARLCEWISQATMRKVEVTALARESLKRTEAIGRMKRSTGSDYAPCKRCGRMHRAKTRWVCWQCRSVKRAA